MTDDIPNFVVFRGSLPPGFNEKNWIDNLSPSTKEEYITIEHADAKGILKTIFSNNRYKIAFILVH